MTREWILDTWRVRIIPQEEASTILLPVTGTHTGTIQPASVSPEVGSDAGGFLIASGERAGVRTADCMPLVITTVQQALVLHISRKSLLRSILDQVALSISLPDIEYVWIGPHICEKHFGFEYEGEEIQQFTKLFPTAVERRKEKTYLSLRQAVGHYLEKWEILPEMIVDTNTCTYEGTLPSWRRWREENGDVKPFPQFVTVVEKLTDTAD
ncbi:MAG: laccase domain-containing protein [Candidatus Andersenbacteria bacterium]